jgi:hypothetical protein
VLVDVVLVDVVLVDGVPVEVATAGEVGDARCGAAPAANGEAIRAPIRTAEPIRTR